MKILINFSAMKAGGGQNVAMNFLHVFRLINLNNFELHFCVAKNSLAHVYLREINYKNYFVVSSNTLLRIIQEPLVYNLYCYKNSIDIVYSYFGYAFLTRNIIQVVGSADSNLYFPEIDFWSQYSGLKRSIKKIIDRYRLFGVMSADLVFFENSFIENRAITLFNCKNTRVVLPSIKILGNEQQSECNDNDVIFGLFLCGWQLNKNIYLIPPLLAKFKSCGVDFHIKFSVLPDGSDISNDFVKSVRNYGVCDRVHYIGTVLKENIPAVYNSVDFVFLLSKLESFSNNIIESWSFGKPLVISNEPWAAEICQDAAIYVQRDSVDDIFKSIMLYRQNLNMLSEILLNGKKMLSKYPSIEERIITELHCIKDFFNERNSSSHI